MTGIARASPPYVLFQHQDRVIFKKGRLFGGGGKPSSSSPIKGRKGIDGDSTPFVPLENDED